MSNKEQLSHFSNPASDYQPIEPYIGPRPFGRDKHDQLRFFGRDSKIDEIIALMNSYRIVLVYGQSGVGKTSIFNAGVIPLLENEGFEVFPMARVKVTSTTSWISPKNTDNDISSQTGNVYIFNTLQSLLPEKDPKSLDLSSFEFFEFLDKYFPPREYQNGEMRQQVLVFDQLEDLFTFYPDDWKEQRKGFFRQVADSMDNNPFLRVVFILREDYLANLDPFRSIFPDHLRAQFRLEGLGGKEATLAIKRPLQSMIEKISEEERTIIESEIDSLVNELLKMNVEGPGGEIRRVEREFVEPLLLQVMCGRWWRERETSTRPGNKPSSREDFNIDRTLQDFYEDAIVSASKQTGVPESRIRIWCQENLLTSGGTRSLIHRGPKSTLGIDNKVLDWLESKFLIRKEWRAGALWYELTHDSLIKPLVLSNMKWKDVNDRKRKRKLVVTTSIIATTVAAISTLIVILGIGI
jgi:hypothetical protein